MSTWQDLKRQHISAPVLNWFRRALPPMSNTERIALEAGTVDWDRELYCGRPDWQRLRSMASPPLRADEQAFVDGPVEELCARVDDWEITHRRKDLSPALWDFLRDHRFFGMIIPKRYGGLEFSARAHSAVIMKIASRSLSAAITAMLPNSLGPAELLLRYGTPAQKDHYLPRLASGDELPCFALTGPTAGSDAASIPDSGVVCWGAHNGERLLGMRLNWNKRYITLAPVASVMGLAFHLYDPQHLLGRRDDLGITLALIPTDTPGVVVGRRHYPARLAFQNGPTRGHDVFVPLDWIIGGRAQIGHGWRMLMECLSAGRAISLPSISNAALQMAARNAGAYARVRRQFHTAVGHFEGVQEPLARIAACAYAGDALRETTACFVDLGQRPSVLSAVAKQRSTAMMREAVNDAMDVFAGRGICDGPNNPIFRHYLGIPIGITVEGANILTRCLIIFGQGAIRGHPWLLQEMDAARDPHPSRALDRFDQALTGHLRWFFANLGRCIGHGLSGGRFAVAPDAGQAKPYYRKLSRMATSFALATDLAMLTLGGQLKRREFLSGRLADVFSELYTAGCVLRRFEQQGANAADLPLVHWSVTHGLYQAQQALLGLSANLPNRPAGWLLRRMLFPWGPWAAPPGDAATREAAQLLLAPSAARDRLTAGVYTGGGPDDVSGRLDHALNRVSATAHLERRIRKAQRSGQLSSGGQSGKDLVQNALTTGVIDHDEAQSLRDAAAASDRAIQVDDFDPAELSGGRVTGQAGRARSATLIAEAS